MCLKIFLLHRSTTTTCFVAINNSITKLIQPRKEEKKWRMNGNIVDFAFLYDRRELFSACFLDRRKWAWSIIDSIDWAENDLRKKFIFLVSCIEFTIFIPEQKDAFYWSIYKEPKFDSNLARIIHIKKFQSRRFPVKRSLMRWACLVFFQFFKVVCCFFVCAMRWF